jgi:ketosteroid isomerase-like protein
MKVVLGLLGVLLVAAAASAAQEPARDPRVAEEVRNLERSKFDALQRGDSSTLEAMLDDELLWVDPNGTLWAKAGYLANMHSPTWHLLQMTAESMTLQVFGDAAIVVGIYHERGVRGGHPYVERCRFIDTWVLKNGKWMCIAVTTTLAIAS